LAECGGKLRLPTCLDLRVVAALACWLAASGPACAATQNASVNAQVVKPLAIRWLQDLNVGTIILVPGSWSNATVAISRTGAFTCANSNVTCTGATQVAKYNVSGSNNQTVRISAPNVTLVNQSNPAKTLTLVPDNPGTLVLTSSGPPGVNFSIGGSITLSSTAAAGLYTGTFNVTVDY
jgi:hypothetical protein